MAAANRNSSTESPEELLESAFETWRRSLVDLSKRNRLINLRFANRSPVQITNSDVDELFSDSRRMSGWKFRFIESEVAGDETESDEPGLTPVLRAQQRALGISKTASRDAVTPTETDGSDVLITRDENAADLRKKLRNLARRSRQVFEERALRVLYLTVGQLEWTPPGESNPILSPLILIPVSLEREGPDSDYELKFVDDDVLVNPALRIKLESDLGLTLPTDWEFEDKLLSMELAEISAFAEGHGWKVNPNAELAILQFQKMAIYEDLLQNREKVLSHEIVRTLVLGNAERQTGVQETEDWSGAIDSMPALDTMTILDADSSQLECVRSARTGKSFVIQGPPGTGKSQTIANLIADQIMRGKRVLFVSEKIAALEVVQQRLAHRGLAHAVLELHSDKSSRKNVVSELHETLTHSISIPNGASERQLRAFERARAKLNEFVEELHRPRRELLGRSAFEANGMVLRMESIPVVHGAPESVLAQAFNSEDALEKAIEVIRNLESVWELPADAPKWNGFSSFDVDPESKLRVERRLRVFADASLELDSKSSSLFRSTGIQVPDPRTDLTETFALLRHLAAAPSNLSRDWITESTLSGIRANLDQAQATYAKEAILAAGLEDAYEHFVRSSGPKPRLAPLVSALEGLKTRWGAHDSVEEPFLSVAETRVVEVTNAQTSLESASAAVPAVSNIFGLDPAEVTLELAVRISQVSPEVMKAAAPIDPLWLNSTALGLATSAFESVGPQIQRFQELHKSLSAKYQEPFFELDGAAASAILEGAGGALRRTFNTEFRDLKKAIAGLAAAGNSFSFQSAKADIALLTEMQSIEVSLGNHHRAAELLGSGYRGPATDTAQLQRGLELAVLVCDRFADATSLVSDGFCSMSHLGANEMVPVLKGAEELGRSVTTLQADLEFVSTNFPAADFPDSANMDAIGAELASLRSALMNLESAREELGRISIVPKGPCTKLGSDQTSIDELDGVRSQIEHLKGRWNAVIGSQFADERTDWVELGRRIDWIDALKNFDGAWPLPQGCKTILIDNDFTKFAAFESELRRLQANYMSAKDEVDAEFAENSRVPIDFDGTLIADITDESLSLGEQGEMSMSAIGTIDALPNWGQFARIGLEATGKGWGEFIRSACERGVRASELGDAAVKSAWTSRMISVYSEIPQIRESNGNSIEALRKKFDALDRELLACAPAAVAKSIADSAPSNQVWQGSEKSVLNREAKKRGRFMSVRRLFESIPTLLPELKPCLMMSPLTVSSYLSSNQHFDLVVFDEASQVKTEDAINCIYRGSQLVVAGDDKQLPPTSFFDTSVSEDENETIDDLRYESVESLLDECTGRFDSCSLLWHYRSLDESLIAFSNRQFYGNRLVTFPSARLDDPEHGVKFHKCEGAVYDRGASRTNRLEARAVAARVFEILESGETTSVGVVALSSAQENAIQEELDQIRIANRSFEPLFGDSRLSSVFVKNLESVQGDQREVILLSVGYGPDQYGKMTNNFGPLNSSGGERRWNVAVTRAEKRVELFASFSHNQLNLEGSKSSGARVLKAYLEYAQRGEQSFISPFGSGGDPDSDFEVEVIEAIRANGFEAHPQVGASGYKIDIGVVDPADRSRYLAGVECDGATYHSSPSARERDRLREEVLRGQGWKIIRVWSTDWFRDSNLETAKLIEKLSGLDTTTSPVLRSDEPPEVERRRRTIREHRPGRNGGRNWFAKKPVGIENITQAVVAANAARLTEEFGGVNDRDEFLRALANSLGYVRMTDDVQKRLKELLDA